MAFSFSGGRLAGEEASDDLHGLGQAFLPGAVEHLIGNVSCIKIIPQEAVRPDIVSLCAIQSHEKDQAFAAWFTDDYLSMQPRRAQGHRQQLTQAAVAARVSEKRDLQGGAGAIC